jgi:lysophospholipase L1-like esterase
VANLGAPGSVVVFFGDSITQGYRAVAKRYGAVLVEDVMRGILGSPDLKLDTIHPNAEGHRVIAERVVRVLRPLLREADRRRGTTVRQSADFPLIGLRAVATLHAK